MKKIISIILAMAMLFSCGTCLSALAAEEESSTLEDIIGDVTNMENFQNSVVTGSSGFVYAGDGDVDEMLAAGEIEGEMLGVSVDYLYNSISTLHWNEVDVDKNDLSLAKANINSYLKRLLYNEVGGFNLYLMSDLGYGKGPAANYYATSIANFLGNLFYPDFKEVSISFEDNETVKEDDFYGAIVEESGFGELLQYNWCNQGRIDFRPLLQIWGLSLENILDSEYYDGYRLGKKLVKAVINKFVSEGPVNALLDIIYIYSRSYTAYLYDATCALFNLKIAAGIIDPSELESMHGIFNLVVNNNDPQNTSALQFVQMPTKRFTIAADTTELFLYMLIYLNINSQFRNNENVINEFKNDINSSALSGEDKTVMKAIVDVLLKGDLNEFVNYLTSLFAKNLQETPNDFLKRIQYAIAEFFNRIAEYFETMIRRLTGEEEFPRWD